MPKPAKNELSPRTSPLWKGPYLEGISQSLLSRFIVCPERFRLLAMCGLKEREQFSHAIEYGHMWHTCEESYAARKDWQRPLADYVVELGKLWPDDHTEIEKWYQVCCAEFKVYVKHYKEIRKKTNSKPLLQEYEFDVPYKLPSGRVVILRGKFDSVDLEGKKSVYLQENKTKGDVHPERVVGEIGSNLQTMIYLTALKEVISTKFPGKQVCGVYYNIARRPLSDRRGKFNISQRKGRKTKKGIVGAETPSQFYARLGRLIEDNVDHFFFRIRVEVSKYDIEKFQTQCLNPRLEYLCDWWEWIIKDPDNPWRKGNKLHYRAPFGVYDPLLEGRQGDYYDYLNTGSTRGLQRVETLFRELPKHDKTKS